MTSPSSHPPLSQALVALLSFLVFSFLDFLDALLCFAFQALDAIFDSETSTCYCERRRRLNAEASSIAESSSQGSVTLYDRKRIRRRHSSRCWAGQYIPPDSRLILQCTPADGRANVTSGISPSMDSLNSSKMSSGRKPRWSDCSCKTCTSWQSSEKELLYVCVQRKDQDALLSFTKSESPLSNILFIHGFLSSSSLWTEKVIPNLPESTKTSYRMYSVDLLGFGKSPKPRNCFYNMEDHIERIEVSVLQRYGIDSFHLVAHSMGCIVALALAAAHADAVKTITLVAPPYFPPPDDEPAASYVLSQVAPRRVWPPIAFGASVMSWYEHIGRGICFLVCKHHRLWERIVNLLTRNRFWIRDFMQHTHDSAWHIFHNIICGEADALDGYISVLERADCEIHVFHGREDTVVPAYCSLELQKRHPNVKLNILDEVNHFSIIFGREKIFSHALNEIWEKCVVGC